MGNGIYRPTQAYIYGETMGDKRRQDLGKAGTTSNTGTRVGNNGIHGEIRSLEGGYNPNQKHHPTQAHM